jgi:hypothetical protein
MPRKKAPQTKYIAFDNANDELIAVGTRDEVTEAVNAHIDSNALDEDEWEEIKIFELGSEKSLLIDVQKTVEVSF